MQHAKPEKGKGWRIARVYRTSFGNALLPVLSAYFGSLSSSILDAFDFDHDHLYEFTYKNRTVILNRINYPYTDEPPFTDEVLIGDLALKPGTVITYLFDFGDNWKFDVKLERIDPVDHEMKKPVILPSHGSAPEQYSTWDEEWDEE